MKTTLLHNAQIINEGESYIGSVLVSNGTINKVYRTEVSNNILAQTNKVIDCTGLYLIPGIIDDQVHFREPGLTHKGDIESESKAAVAGGVTSYLEMPNTKPATINYEALMDKRQRASNTSWANYGFYVGGTNRNAQDIFKIDPSLFPGYKLFLGSSTGNMLVDSAKALDEFFAESPKVIAIHSESEPIIQANKEFFIERYGIDPPIACHPLIRSEEACYRSTAEAMERATKYGTHLHILHLTTAKEALLLKSNLPFTEKKITAEACTPHLWFTDADYSEKGSLVKWNPAVKTASDRDIIRKALQSNWIDIIATDHAPHLLEEKQGGALKAASGGPLIQFAALVILELVKQGILSLQQAVAKMCHNPAIRFGIIQRGFIREGYKADLTLISPNTPTKVERSNKILSKCAWSPFEGTTFSTSIFATMVNGNFAYYDGKLTTRPNVEALTFTSR